MDYDQEQQQTSCDLLESMALNGECPGEEILRLRAHVAELERLVGWAQHHVDRSAPACVEFMGRASDALGHNRAMRFSPAVIEPRPDESEEGGV